VTGRPPFWDPSSSPSDPRELFIEWLTAALDAGVSEPLATVLSTIAADGAPDSRTLLLKDVTDDFGLAFATGAESLKSAQLDVDPRCALTLYWSPLARAVRIRGIATRGSREEASADFLARHPDARAVALVGRQSSAMADVRRHAELIDEQRGRIEADPGLVAPNWATWQVSPTQVEFWQAAPSRDHLRVRYERRGDTWMHERIWP
jgi:pyridoxamine 5'-phosphate oxidase